MEIANNRKPKDYQNGKIYSIRSYQTDLIYIGSTTQPLSKRLSKHRCDFNSWKNNIGGYVTSFEIIKFDDHYIELIENYPCNSKNELVKREGQLIRETENTVNKNIAGRNTKEWNEDNKEKVSEYKKQYYEENKEQLSEKQKQYYEENKEQLLEKQKQYREDNKEQILEKQKQYYEDNKEQILEQQKQYYEDNKQKITQKYNCECGGHYIHCGEARHIKTKKHQKYINEKQLKDNPTI
jgi:hypothetical protein